MPTRRHFLRRTAGAALLLPLAGPAARTARGAPPAPLPRPAADGFNDLRGGVGYFVGQGGPIGYLATAAGLVVVDTQSPASAAVCLAGVRERAGGRRVDVLVNTHHHGDHTGGNPVFAPHADRMVAHVAVPGLQRAAAVQRGTYDAQAYPNETFDDMWTETVGGETVTARYVGPAHTAGDIVVHFLNANVAHVGDLLFNRRPAAIDLPGGASTPRWIAALERMHAGFDDATLLVWGHAGAGRPVSGPRAELLAMRDYLAALNEAVAAGVAAGKSADEVAAAGLPAFPDYALPDRPDAVGANLRLVYQEQTRR